MAHNATHARCGVILCKVGRIILRLACQVRQAIKAGPSRDLISVLVEELMNLGPQRDELLEQGCERRER